MKQIASPGLRLLSGAIDSLLGLLVFTLTLFLLSSAVTLVQVLNQTLTNIILLIGGTGFVLPFISVFMTCLWGGTPGKLVTGIRVVDVKGQHPNLKQAFFRNWIGYMVSGSMLCLGCIWILVDKERRAWHDMIADTWVVVRQKQGLIFGGIALVILIVTNLYLLGISVSQFQANLPFYQETIQDLKNNLSSPITDF